ncbi:MAG: ATP-binding protein [Cyclobacteriaceae bacterium]
MESNSTFVKIERLGADKLLQLATSFKAIAVTGPRQSGKTTLVKDCFPDHTYVSLENPDTRSFAIDDPRGFISQYQTKIILDEIQRAPQLLSYLQQVLDESEVRGNFILTGSNNLLLMESISQSLAGRAAYFQLLPFALTEVERIPNAFENLNDLLWKGSYPSVLAKKNNPSDWYPAYIRTYVERDVRQIKNIENLQLFERFLRLCAGRSAQRMNYNNLSVETGIDNKTVKSWLGILEASYVIFQLPPYYKNFNKRITKMPKLYFYDTGLLCQLLRITNAEMLNQHPYRGAIFENFIICEALKNRLNKGQVSNLYYWLDNTGNEIDLIIDNMIGEKAYEIKSGQTVNDGFFKNLIFWKKLTGQEDSAIIYGGDEVQHRTGMDIISWREVKEI